MPAKPNSLRNKIITAVIAVMIAGTIPSSIWLHNAWGDDRYVLKIEDIRSQILAIDHALFETDQELLFAETDQDKAKWQARINYYLRQKEALTQRLSDTT